MRVSVKMNLGALRTVSASQAQALAMTAQQMLNETRNDAVIPFDTGALQNEGTHVDDSKITKGIVSIVSDTPYARRLYFNPQYNFNSSKNVNARGEWWEEWLTGDKRTRPMKLFKQFYTKCVGGIVK